MHVFTAYLLFHFLLQFRSVGFVIAQKCENVNLENTVDKKVQYGGQLWSTYPAKLVTKRLNG